MRLECGCPDNWPDWHDLNVNLGGELAHTLPVRMFLHMPIGYEMRVERQRRQVEQLQLQERWPGLVLTRSSAFRGQILRLLKEAVCPARHLVFLPTPFHLRGALHLGDMDTISTSVKTVQQSLIAEGRRPHELYLCYLTCPQCRIKRGGDRILLLRRWTESAALLKRRKSAASVLPGQISL